MSFRTSLSSIAFTLIGAISFAGISSDEIARLGDDLTPVGAIMAGNADGTIPAWDGGITEAPAGYTPGMHHIDPYADDDVLFTIIAGNMGEYADKLAEGHKALLQAYDTYKLPVYPTHRSANSPQRVYDATKEAAATATLINNGNGVQGAAIGIPFPIPSTGQEVIWNHLLRYRGVSVGRFISQAAPTRRGSYSLVTFSDEFLMNYHRDAMTADGLNNVLTYFRQEVLSPARLAGSILMVHETLDQVKEQRRAWIYNVGQRRVRRAPNVAHDNPGTAADGMRTSDQFDMFNGAIDRYDWELLGRKEIYVPYNAYNLHSDSHSYKDILTPLHINQDLTRYELHRVWVVDAKVRSDTSHIYSRRTFYVDEDSWQILVVDQYDTRGEIWRVSEGHCINYYDEPTFWTTLETHVDLNAGRYLAIGLDNESKMYDFDLGKTPDNYTPAALRRQGVR